MLPKISHQNHPQPLQIRAQNPTKPSQKIMKNPCFHATGFALLLGSDFVKFFLSKTAKTVGIGCVNPKKKFWVFTNKHRALVRAIPRSVKTLEISVQTHQGDFCKNPAPKAVYWLDFQARNSVSSNKDF